MKEEKEHHALVHTYPCLPVAHHDDCQRSEVQHREYLLRQEYVLALVRQLVQPREDVDVRGRVDERAGAARDLCVVALAADELRHLFHVRDPVDLGICVGARVSRLANQTLLFCFFFFYTNVPVPQGEWRGWAYKELSTG